MTYFQFLLVFLIAPILVLALAVRWRVHFLERKVIWKWISAIALIAFAYTTPWDNYLVYKEVWYYGLDRVKATIGYVPIEEYAFFLLQPYLTGLFLANVLQYKNGSDRKHLNERVPTWWKNTLIAFWIALMLLGAGALVTAGSYPELTYVGLILAWACPVLAGMSWLSADTFWRYRGSLIWAVSIPTIYLWVADRFAISRGIWDISNIYSLDIDPFGLPVEEALFFLVTNVLVVQGLLMFLPLDDSKLQ